jgi:hypothetical protein
METTEGTDRQRTNEQKEKREGAMKESIQTGDRWVPWRKAALVLALLRGWDAEELARRNGLSPAHLAAWRDRFLRGGQAALKIRQATGDRACERRVRQLVRKIRRLTQEIELIRKNDRRAVQATGACIAQERYCASAR